MSDRDQSGAQAWRRAYGRPPLILGHRGARGRAPENTFAGFDLAMDEGADGVELDVRLCGSGEVVVCHDPTLERVTSGADPRTVERIPLAELERVDVGSGQHVPTLQAVLAWAERRNARVNVEVKRDVGDLALLLSRVARVVLDLHGAPNRVLFSSFDLRAVRWLAQHAHGVAVGWLVHQGQRFLRRAPGWRWIGAQAVHPEQVLCTESAVRRWKHAGAIVNPWTVNDPDAAARLAAFGVDTIIGDDAGALVRRLR